ncbi:hypothetical protein WG66_013219 [Moniliophthora roreri]|nr:hypothetical protein WG66_013219 [Moniliophthora roreri]
MNSRGGNFIVCRSGDLNTYNCGYHTSKRWLTGLCLETGWGYTTASKPNTAVDIEGSPSQATHILYF